MVLKPGDPRPTPGQPTPTPTTPSTTTPYTREQDIRNVPDSYQPSKYQTQMGPWPLEPGETHEHYRQRISGTLPPDLSNDQQKLSQMIRTLEIQPITNKYQVGNQTLTRDEAIQRLKSQLNQLSSSETQYREQSEYYTNLRKIGFSIYRSSTGELIINPPKGMTDTEELYFKILYSTGQMEFTTESGKVLTKEEALALLKEQIKLGKKIEELKELAFIDWSGDIPKELWDFLGYVFISQSQLQQRPLSVGGAYVTEAAAYSFGLSPVGLTLSALSPDIGKSIQRYQQDLTEQRFELQAGVLLQWENASKEFEKGNYEPLRELATQSIVEYGTVIATVYLGSAAIGAVTSLAEGALGATVMGISTKVAVKTALTVGLGGWMATEIGATIAAIYVLEEQIAALDKEDEEYKKEVKKLQRKITQKVTYFGQLAVFIVLSLGLSKAGMGRTTYRQAYSRGYQHAYGKTRFPLGSPQRGIYKHGIKTVRALETTKPKMYRDLKYTFKVSKPRTLYAKKYLSKKGATIGGSAATHMQVPKGRQPKDIDTFFPTEQAAKTGRLQIKKKIGTYGFDIHGPDMYKPGELYGHGIWQQKPVKLGKWDAMRIGEQIGRKGTVTMELMAGEKPIWRVKDIPDFFNYTEAQIATAKKGSWWQQMKAVKAQYHYTKFKAKFEALYGKPPYTLEQIGEFGKLVPATKTPIIPTGKTVLATEEFLASQQPISAYKAPITPTTPKVYPYPQITSHYPVIPVSTYKVTPLIDKPTIIQPKLLTPSTTPQPYYKQEGTKPYPTIYPLRPKEKPERPVILPITTKPELKKKKYTPDTGQQEIKPLKQQKGFHTYVKSKGTYKKITPKPLPKQQALGKGAYYADNTPARTFYIKPAKKSTPVHSEPLYNHTFAIKRHKFRPKIKRKQYVGGNNKWIEKNTYLIDTPGEIKGITVKGLIKLEKLRTQGWKPTKITKKIKYRRIK